MKNLLRFVMAVLVTGFTYIAFVSGTLDVTSNHRLTSPLSFGDLLSHSQEDTSALHEEPVRKLNYASFRKSLMRHRRIYYANQD